MPLKGLTKGGTAYVTPGSNAGGSTDEEAGAGAALAIMSGNDEVNWPPERGAGEAGNALGGLDTEEDTEPTKLKGRKGFGTERVVTGYEGSGGRDRVPDFEAIKFVKRGDKRNWLVSGFGRLMSVKMTGSAEPRIGDERRRGKASACGEGGGDVCAGNCTESNPLLTGGIREELPP